MKNTYWNDNGKYQTLRNELCEIMDGMDLDGRSFRLATNTYWALFNGMLGIYYGKFNDGDNVAGAIDNNRAQGFESVDAFLRLCRDVGAPKNIETYIQTGGRGEKNLEKVMDSTILFVSKNV